MAVASKTRNMLEGLVREGSFKWLLGKRTSFAEEFEEMERSPTCGKNWVKELSPIANIVVRRCSKILEIPSSELQESFNEEASEFMKHSSRYARNFLEYCCFRALASSTKVIGYLSDKKFGRLTFDMMLAWETPAASSESLLNVDEDASASLEAFSRIAPAVPLIANVIVSENIFELLTTSTGGRLQFSTYDKYLIGLERLIRRMKTQTESSLLSAVRSTPEEKILVDVDGTVTTQPVLQHVGTSTWPGRLTLTDHALYFEAFRVVSYDKPKRYDLSDDLKQVVKPEMTGPWGTRLFDKAVFYNSISLSEPVVIEFPELKGHDRRDYWLAIIREILYVHRFINKYQLKGIGKGEAIWNAVLGILRVQAIQEISAKPINYEGLLIFNLCDQLPGGDLILETLATASTFRKSDRNGESKIGGGMYSMSALDMVSNLGFVFGSTSSNSSEASLAIREISVGGLTALERAVLESKINYKKVVSAKATVDGVKVDGIDTNLAVMKELLHPLNELGKWLQSLAWWDDPLKSLAFCLVASYIIYRGWLRYAIAGVLISISSFMLLNRLFNQGKHVDEVKVTVPPPMNTMEQLLAVQNAVSQGELLIQDGNIVLLKLRGLLLSLFPKATEQLAFSLLFLALILAVIPMKYIFLLVFLNAFTMYSPQRRTSTERWTRRMREWWFSIPAAPVILEKEKDEKKKK